MFRSIALSMALLCSACGVRGVQLGHTISGSLSTGNATVQGSDTVTATIGDMSGAAMPQIQADLHRCQQVATSQYDYQRCTIAAQENNSPYGYGGYGGYPNLSYSGQGNTVAFNQSGGGFSDDPVYAAAQAQNSFGPIGDLIARPFPGMVPTPCMINGRLQYTGGPGQCSDANREIFYGKRNYGW
jgi:hypothetical protein